jgi:CRP/FNR family transcriptional regulator, cyclic AMP receptor protein
MAAVEVCSVLAATPRSQRKAIAEGYETLDGVEILRSLTAEARRRLAAQCKWRHADPRQQIVGQEEDSPTVFLLTAGKATAAVFSENGMRVTFRDIGAGEVFGEFAAIDGRAQAATVEAVTRCIVAMLPADAFWQLLYREPTVMAALLKRVTAQARQLSKKVFDFATLPAGRRVQAELLRLGESSPTTLGKAVLYPAPSDAEIAAQVASTRETVNRQLGEMIEAGIVERRGRTMIIIDVEKMRQFIASHPTAGQQPNAARRQPTALSDAVLAGRIGGSIDPEPSRLEAKGPALGAAVH